MDKEERNTQQKEEMISTCLYFFYLQMIYKGRRRRRRLNFGHFNKFIKSIGWGGGINLLILIEILVFLISVYINTLHLKYSTKNTKK